jgi:hypothetical protein
MPDPLWVKNAGIVAGPQQATYLCELLDIFESEGIDNAFVNTFVRYDPPRRAHPAEDLDLGRYGIVKPLERAPGQDLPGHAVGTNLAFTALAERYRG